MAAAITATPVMRLTGVFIDGCPPSTGEVGSLFLINDELPASTSSIPVGRQRDNWLESHATGLWSYERLPPKTLTDRSTAATVEAWVVWRSRPAAGSGSSTSG